MVLRGIAARQLLSLTIFALTVVVVAGTVAAVGFSRLTSVSQGSAGALVLLGLVALGAQTAEAIRRRQHDLALARLRGRTGVRLLYFAVAEPTVIVLLGAILGVGCGWVVGRVAASAWLPSGTAFTLQAHEWIAAGIVTCACLVVVTASAWRLLRAPLVEQIAAARRPTSAGTWTLLIQLILVLGAVVAVYQAHQDSASRVDWVSLISPAVVGLAAGQVLIWLMMSAFAVIVPRTRGAGLGWFLTVRRLLRRADSLALIRIVVAAGVVFGVAASASSAAEGWRVERAKLQVGAPVSYRIPGGALTAYADAHRADPQGKWLMPIAAYTTDTSQGARRVFVDASRWRAVLGDFYAGSSTAPLTAALERFPRATPVQVLRGDSLAMTFTTDSVPRARNLVFTFQYIDDTGNLTVQSVRVNEASGTNHGDVTTFAKPVHDCNVACTMLELDLNGNSDGALHLTSATLGGTSLIGSGSGFHGVSRPVEGLHVTQAGEGLFVNAGHQHFFFDGSARRMGRYARSPGRQPAVATPGASFVISTGPPAIPGVDGRNQPIRVLARVPALPFVGTSGTILDLGRALRGSGGSVPGTYAAVLARANTPASVIRELRADGGVGAVTTADQELQRLRATPRAQGTRLYLVIAVFAAMIALLSLASGVAQQRLERRTEAASLRSAGVRIGQINKAYSTEVMLLGAATLVGTAIACWASCKALLGALPLVSGWAFAPPLDASPHLTWVLLSAVVAGAVVVGLGYLAFHRVGRSAAPRLLREDVT